ncbi:response regulator transcription factor [Vallitalea okinawensis]|uniref:response regulator transcription factor n=1 Tax=Vallitalea okinawensis TaxID=2078660 RepID=UPI001FA8D2DF|nr:helix-turn-helix transcriptional regulator [Vallitalea okinawensis]
MNHLLFFYHLIAFVFGVSTITLLCIAYYKYKNSILITLISILIAISIIVFEQSLTTYQVVNKIEMGVFYYIIKIISWLSTIILIYTIPKLSYQLFQKHLWKQRKLIFLIIAAASFVFMIVYYGSFKKMFINLAGLLLFGSISFSFSILIRNRANINDPIVKRIFNSYIIMSVIFIPVMFLDTKVGHFIALTFQYGLLTLPTFYLVFNLMTLYWVIKILISVPHLIQNVMNEKDPIEVLCKKYLITKREREVVLLLINGYSYNDIADGLTISISTVKTHVRNIYRKLSINNKIELINLINIQN